MPGQMGPDFQLWPHRAGVSATLLCPNNQSLLNRKSSLPWGSLWGVLWTLGQRQHLHGPCQVNGAQWGTLPGHRMSNGLLRCVPLPPWAGGARKPPGRQGPTPLPRPAQHPGDSARNLCSVPSGDALVGRPWEGGEPCNPNPCTGPVESGGHRRAVGICHPRPPDPGPL